MTRADREQRVDRLREASQRKSQESVARARRAIMSLENRGCAINFNTVAGEAKVSKDFLYSNSDLRALITQKRGAGIPGPGVRAGTATSDASAAVKLAVATEALQRAREENALLRAENAQLLGELIKARSQASPIRD